MSWNRTWISLSSAGGSDSGTSGWRGEGGNSRGRGGGGADDAGDELLLAPAEGAVRHGPARGAAVWAPELGERQEHAAHLRHEVDLEPCLGRFADLLVLGRQLVDVGDVDDLHAFSLTQLRRVRPRPACPGARFL